MSKKAFVTTAVLCALAFVLSGQRPPRAPARRVAAAAPQGMLRNSALEQSVRSAFSASTLRFEENLGQTDPRVKFVARGSNYMLFLTPQEAALSIHTPRVREKRPPQLELQDATWAESLGAASVVRVEFAGGNAAAKLTGLDSQPGTINYIRGNDPNRWQRNVPHFGRVRYEGIYPGVDAVFYGDRSQMEYDFVVAPGADPSVIRMRVEGAASLALTEDGGLEARTPAGVVSLLPPKLYQQRGGAKQEIAGRYVWRAPDEIGFEVAAFDRSQALVIDPATHVNRAGNRPARKNQIVPDVPPPTGGSVALSTQLGGSQDDSIQAIAISATTGHVYVAGFTDSTFNFFPLVGAGSAGYGPGGTPFVSCQIPQSPCGDAFVAEFDVSTITAPVLVTSTYIGGSNDDVAWGLELDAHDDPYVIGQTDSFDFPTTANAFQSAGNLPDFNGCGTPAQPRACHHVFFSVFSSDLSQLTYSTYLAGSDDDEGYAVAVDSTGNAFLTGVAGAGFPVAPTGDCSPCAFQSAYGGGGDAFVAEFFNPACTTACTLPAGAQVYTTYIGGLETDAGLAIALDASDNTFVGGVTFSTTDGTFLNPGTGGAAAITPDSLQSTTNDTATCGPGFVFVCGDGFLIELNSTGSVISYGTFLGGGNADQVNAIAITSGDGFDNVYATGQTHSCDFQPVAIFGGTPFQSACGGGYDAFVVGFTSIIPGNEFLATYLGGSNDDIGLGIALDINGDVYISGSTFSGNQDDSTMFPLANPLQANSFAGLQGNSTSFVSVVDPTGTNLLFSTYYGGNFDYFGNYSTDVGNGIALDSNGLIYLAGRSTSFTNANNSTNPQGEPALCLINQVPGANNDQNQFGNGYNSNNGFLTIINPTNAGSPATSGAAACFSPSLTVAQPPIPPFPATLKGKTSGAEFETIYNQGSTALTNTITFTGANPTDFPETDNCATVAGGSASCQISVTFSPKTGAAESATMVITNNSAGSPFMISLSGTGLPPATSTLTPNPLPFGTVQVGTPVAMAATLTNTSTTSPLDVASSAITGSGDFTITGDGCSGTTVASGGANTCTIFVTYKPSTTGPATATTLMVTDDGAVSPQSIALTGTGVAPPPVITLPVLGLVFASQGQGTTSLAQSVTITNTAAAGSASLMVTQPLIFTGANPGDFAATGCAAPVLPGAMCTIMVTFDPTATGARSATLQIASNASNGTQTIGVSGTGLAPPTATPSGTVTFPPQVTMTTSSPMNVTLSNTGGSALGITSVGINPASTNPGDFSVVSNGCGTSLGAGANCVVQVTFTPAALGARTAMLEFIDNAGNSPQNVILNGTGATGPTAALTPPTLTFATPQQIMTTSPSQPATLTNGGGAALSITSIVATGDFAVLSSSCGTSLAANSNCPINITFTPSAAGTRNGTLTVMDAVGTQMINLTGTGVTPPTATLSMNTVMFGVQAVGVTTAPMPVTVTNNGGSQLNVATIAPSGDFAETDNCLPSVAPNGGFCTIMITFTPSGVGTRNGSIVIVDNAANNPQTITLSGTGSSNVPGFNLSAPLFFGAVLTGSTSGPQTATITNSGGAPLVIMSAAASGDFAVSANTCGTVPIGQSCMISVTFSPTATGTRTGVLTIMDNAPGNPHTVQLSGIGATITIAPAPGASTMLSVLPGDTAVYSLGVTGTPGLVVTLNLMCASAAPYTLCSVSPSQVTLGGPTPPAVTVTLRTNCNPSTALLPWRPSGGPAPILPAPFAALWVGTVALYALLRRCAPQSRLLSHAAPVLLLLLLVVTWAGCISNPPPAIPNAPTTPIGNYSVTVTANGLNVTQQLVLTLRVI